MLHRFGPADSGSLQDFANRKKLLYSLYEPITDFFLNHNVKSKSQLLGALRTRADSGIDHRSFNQLIYQSIDVAKVKINSLPINRYRQS